MSARKKYNWKSLFETVNSIAIEDLGEPTWTAEVQAASLYLAGYDLNIANQRELSILAIGLYLGSYYIRHFDEKKAQECQPTAIASKTLLPE